MNHFSHFSVNSPFSRQLCGFDISTTQVVNACVVVIVVVVVVIKVKDDNPRRARK